MPDPLRRVAVALSVILLAGVFQGCSSTHDRRDPTGEPFPSVTGDSLEGKPVTVPDSFEGREAVLLIGYDQDAQFDADRWLYGLLQADLDVALLEMPTIPGLFPRVLSGTIDSGMRSGIPQEDWQSVVTLYGSDAETIERFTGSGGRNMRVLLLDRNGKVAWFHDRGFSAGKLIELGEQVAKL